MAIKEKSTMDGALSSVKFLNKIEVGFSIMENINLHKVFKDKGMGKNTLPDNVFQNLIREKRHTIGACQLFGRATNHYHQIPTKKYS